MSKSYDDAFELVENEVHKSCDYYVYSQLRDAIDELDDENEKLRKLVTAWSKLYDMAPYANKVVETMVLRGRIDEMMRDLDFAPADEVEE